MKILLIFIRKMDKKRKVTSRTKRNTLVTPLASSTNDSYTLSHSVPKSTKIEIELMKQAFTKITSFSESTKFLNLLSKYIEYLPGNAKLRSEIKTIFIDNLSEIANFLKNVEKETEKNVLEKALSSLPQIQQFEKSTQTEKILPQTQILNDFKCDEFENFNSVQRLMFLILNSSDESFVVATNDLKMLLKENESFKNKLDLHNKKEESMKNIFNLKKIFISFPTFCKDEENNNSLTDSEDIKVVVPKMNKM